MEAALDSAFQAFLAQAKRIVAKHPQLLPYYRAALLDRGKGLPPDLLQRQVAELEQAAA